MELISTAVTFSDPAEAENIERIPVPQPRSRTRLPEMVEAEFFDIASLK